MRKIEKDMIRAIMNGKNWASANTKVTIVGDDAEIYLHGHHIATAKDCLPLELEVNIDTLARFPTVTTKSRLRALGANVYTRNFITYLDDEEV